MVKASVKKSAGRNGQMSRPGVSALGKELTRIRKLIEKSGEKLLTRTEIEREVADRRHGQF